MSKFLTLEPPKKAQTGLSAFFCARAKLVSQALASLLLVVLCFAQVFASEGKKPTVHLKAFSIERIDWSKRAAETKLSIVIENPGPALKLKDLSYRLKLNDKQAAEGKYEREIKLAAESKTTLDLPCSVDLSALPGVAWGIIARGFDVRYELETEFTVPVLSQLSPRIKTSFGGDLSLVETVSGWTAQIKERVSKK